MKGVIISITIEYDVLDRPDIHEADIDATIKNFNEVFDTDGLKVDKDAIYGTMHIMFNTFTNYGKVYEDIRERIVGDVCEIYVTIYQEVDGYGWWKDDE